VSPAPYLDASDARSICLGGPAGTYSWDGLCQEIAHSTPFFGRFHHSLPPPYGIPTQISLYDPRSPYFRLPISLLLPYRLRLALSCFIIFTDHPPLISCAQNHDARRLLVVLIPHHFYLPDRAMPECQPHLLSHDLDDSWFSITFFVGS